MKGRYRPRSSDAGPAITGPTANARTKTETRRERMVTLVSWNSIATCVTAGAKIDEANGDKKTYNVMIPVVAHFFRFGQFLGFIGSLGPSNVTRFSSIAASSGISSYDQPFFVH